MQSDPAKLGRSCGALSAREMLRSFVIILSVVIFGCSYDPETCYSNSDPSFTKAVSLKLDELSFPYTHDKNAKLCFKPSRKPEFERINDEVTQYYRAVATVLTSQDDKDAVFSWLDSNNIPYYTQDNDRGTFLAIGSLTEELAVENAIILDELIHAN